MPLTAVEDAIDMAHPRRSDMMRTTTKRTPPAMMPTTVQFVAPGVPVLAAAGVLFVNRPATPRPVLGPVLPVPRHEPLSAGEIVSPPKSPFIRNSGLHAHGGLRVFEASQDDGYDAGHCRTGPNLDDCSAPGVEVPSSGQIVALDAHNVVDVRRAARSCGRQAHALQLFVVLGTGQRFVREHFCRPELQ